MAFSQVQHSELVIERASSQHVPQIAELHKSNIAGEDLGQFQDNYLNYYYREVLSSSNIVMVALVHDKVVGFCSLVSNQSSLLIHLGGKHFVNLLRLSSQEWRKIFPFVWRKIAHEICGGKWGKGQISQYHDAVELRAVAVHPDYRKIAVGSRLLYACTNIARENYLLPIVAWISESNEASIRLFVKNSFRKAGTRKDRNGEVLLFLLDS